MNHHRLLIIGTGSIGERHARCLLATGRATLGICEPNASRRHRVAERYGIEAAHGALDEALNASSWDAAVVATPAPRHVEIAHRLVEAGIAPLIEKPLAVDETGVDALRDAASQRGVPVGVAYVYRAHPALGAMRAAIGEQRFGRPVQLVATCGQSFPTYRPAYRETYYAHHATGGGAIQDALTHVINAGEWLVGPIQRLCADAAHQLVPGVEVEDTVHVLARQGPGADVLCSYALNQHQAPNEVILTLACENGTARLELHRHAWRWMTSPDTDWHEETFALADQDDWFTRQEHAWLDVLEGKAAPLCTLDEGLQSLRVNRAALDSAASDQKWHRLNAEPCA